MTSYGDHDPIRGGWRVESYGKRWIWTAVGPSASEGGQAASEDRACELAKAAHRRLNGS